MGRLEIRFGPLVDIKTGKIAGDPSWNIVGHYGLDKPIAVLSGFGSARDASIARRALADLPIDFAAPYEEALAQWNAYGGKAEVMKHVCQYLQW